jgi:hypothetical protein
VFPHPALRPARELVKRPVRVGGSRCQRQGRCRSPCGGAEVRRPGPRALRLLVWCEA